MEGEGGAEDGGEGESGTACLCGPGEVHPAGRAGPEPAEASSCPTPSQAVGLRFCVCRLGDDHSGRSVGSDVLLQVVTSVSVYLPAALGLP